MNENQEYFQKKKDREMLVPIIPELIEATKALGKGEIEVPKEITEIEAMIFSRGKLNAQFFRGIRKNYVVPNWVENMLNPSSKGVISLGHSSWFINSNYRDWMAFGGLDCFSEGTITRKGLIVPLIDGYGLLAGTIIDNEIFYITRDGESIQELFQNQLPIGVNKWKILNNKYEQIVYGGKTDISEMGALIFNKIEGKRNSKLLLSIRPFNQEGVSLIKKITYRPKDQLVIINNESALKLINPPEKIAIANYQSDGDSAISLLTKSMEIKEDQEITVSCNIGFANMTFIFPEKTTKIEIHFRMSRDPFTTSPVLEKVTENWQNKLAMGMQLRTNDLEIDNLYYASLTNLLLLVDPGSITPGPTEYHRFWCRDAAFLINALDRAGYHNYAQEALNQFITRQRMNGFFYSHEGEFDSNGEGIWTLVEHAKYTKDVFWLEKMFEPIKKAAEWIINTRNQKKDGITDKEIVKGLLPPGFSAEHLGPCDYFYWDNFWGVTGLRETAYAAKLLKHENYEFFEKEYQKYFSDLNSSIIKSFNKKQFLPVGPFRDCDSAMIANMCAWHPTKLMEPNNEILMKTADKIFQEFTINGGFFHEVAWNCFGTYLTMHLAQVYAGLNDQEKVSEMMKWLIKFKSCTMGWAEGISPQTMEGGMGDSPHGWASADWIHLLRNLFANETVSGSIELLCGFPVAYLSKGISANNLKTHFGEINLTAKLFKDILEIKLQNQLTIPNIKIRTPKVISELTIDKDQGRILNDDTIELNSNVEKITIKLEK